MQTKQRRKLGRRKQVQELTLFGEWLDTMLAYLGISSYEELAEYCGIHATSLSKGTREKPDAQTYAPSIETLSRLYGAMESIAREKGLPWSDTFKRSLYHAAGRVTEEDQQIAAQHLMHFRRQLLK